MSTIAALAKTDFQRQLAWGQLAETSIARWLRSRGNVILPIYDIEIETGKGPRLFLPGGRELAAPDFVVWAARGGAYWCETKHKSVFTWYRKRQQWETGIDAHHWRQYLQVSNATSLPVWLLFLHVSATPDARDVQHGCPATCPTGLFGQVAEQLRTSVSHESDRHGRHGMVYWPETALRKFATLHELQGRNGCGA